MKARGSGLNLAIGTFSRMGSSFRILTGLQEEPRVASPYSYLHVDELGLCFNDVDMDVFPPKKPYIFHH